jgi:hypothetical protein
MFRHDFPPSGETYKYATAPSCTKKKPWRVSLSVDMLLSAVSVLVGAQSSSEIPKGLMNNPVYKTWYPCNIHKYGNDYLINYAQ